MELYSKGDLKNPAIEIEPLYDRCVIFNTTSSTYHGHPKKLSCLNNIIRKSIALYFFQLVPEIEKMSTHKTIFKEVNGENLKNTIRLVFD